MICLSLLGVFDLSLSLSHFLTLKICLSQRTVQTTRYNHDNNAKHKCGLASYLRTSEINDSWYRGWQGCITQLIYGKNKDRRKLLFIWHYVINYILKFFTFLFKKGSTEWDCSRLTSEIIFSTLFFAFFVDELLLKKGVNLPKFCFLFSMFVWIHLEIISK